MSEEYIVFQLGGRRPGWLEHRADWIAGLVRLESGPLSRERGPRGHPAGPLLHAQRPGRARLGGRLRRRHRLRRYPRRSSSLPTSSSWSSATSTTGSTIGSRPPTGSSVPKRRPWPPRFWRLHGDAVRQIREMEIEATSLFERVDNALKLIGDHYLARVFEVASARFHLRDWQQSIRRKLETVGDVYDLLVQQAGGQRMEALEITVVVLIALEIVLAIFRHEPATRVNDGTYAGAADSRHPRARRRRPRSSSCGQVAAIRSGRRRTRAPAPERPRAWRRSGWSSHPASRTGAAPIEAKNWPIGESATLGLPKKFEIQPRRTGELMSPKRWIRKMNAA